MFHLSQDCQTQQTQIASLQLGEDPAPQLDLVGPWPHPVIDWTPASGHTRIRTCHWGHQLALPRRR